MKRAIWLASYPKSGNTWARLLLFSLERGGVAIELGELGGYGQTIETHELMARWLEIESGDLSEAETEALRPDFHAAYFADVGPTQPYKVHDAWRRTRSGRPIFGPQETAASLYFIRDPRDVAVSWARYVGRPLDAAIDFLANPAARLGSSDRRVSTALCQRIGDWSTNAVSWIDESGLEPLVVRYEDMLAEPVAALRGMAAHIGWTASEGAIAGAVEATRFDRLAEDERRRGFAEGAPSSERFFRAGRAGGWRGVLSPEQARRIERDHGAVMARFGYL